MYPAYRLFSKLTHQLQRTSLVTIDRSVVKDESREKLNSNVDMNISPVHFARIESFARIFITTLQFTKEESIETKPSSSREMILFEKKVGSNGISRIDERDFEKRNSCSCARSMLGCSRQRKQRPKFTIRRG